MGVIMETKRWDLKEIIGDIVSKHSSVEKIYIFGSRAHKTNSRRSDIDLLVHFNEGIDNNSILEWVREKYPPVDIFKTYDLRIAESIVNTSVLSSKTSEDLNDYINAILLWDKENELNEQFENWEQLTDREVKFIMSVVRPYVPENPKEIMVNYRRLLSEAGIPNFDLGSDWYSVGESIENIIVSAFDIPNAYAKRAKSFSFDTIKLVDEYDFQNLIHLLLRSILYTLEIHPEKKVCEFDGNDKIGDFSIQGNKIIIEAKHIKDTSSKNTVLKTLEGLKSFYKMNPNVRVLNFFVLYENVKLDERLLEGQFSSKNSTTPVFVKFIKNVYK